MSKPKFVYVTYIRTTPEKLWAALTDPQTIKKYWFNITAECDWEPGSPWSLKFADGRTADTGEILEAVPPRRLVIRWRNEFKPELKAEGYSRCTMEIEMADYSIRTRAARRRSLPSRTNWKARARNSSRPFPAAGRRSCRTSNRCSRLATSRSRRRLKAVVDRSQFKPKTVYVIYIAAPPENVWRALTDPEQSQRAAVSKSSRGSAVISSSAFPTAG